MVNQKSNGLKVYDLYTMGAARLYGVMPDEVTKEQRRQVKNKIFYSCWTHPVAAGVWQAKTGQYPTNRED